MNDINYLRRRVLKLGFSAALVWPILSCGKACVSISNYTITHSRFELLTRTADLILPESESPSATQAHAHIFALNVVIEAKAEEYSDRFFKDLEAFEEGFLNKYGRSFIESNLETTKTYLSQCLSSPDVPGHWFIQQFRQFLIIGWVLNEEVAHSVFGYQDLMGNYLPSTENEKIILTNVMDRFYLI